MEGIWLPSTKTPMGSSGTDEGYAEKVYCIRAIAVVPQVQMGSFGDRDTYNAVFLQFSESIHGLDGDGVLLAYDRSKINLYSNLEKRFRHKSVYGLAELMQYMKNLLLRVQLWFRRRMEFLDREQVSAVANSCLQQSRSSIR